jgi:hypothetical protein
MRIDLGSPGVLVLPCTFRASPRYLGLDNSLRILLWGGKNVRVISEVYFELSPHVRRTWYGEAAHRRHVRSAL